MTNYKFNLIPKKVKLIKTKYRNIISKIPPQKTVDVIANLAKYEPSSMLNELPVLWDHAEGYNVYDSSGNYWLDFSSGIFVANVGHSNPHVCRSIIEMVQHQLIHNYYFPSEIRARLVEKIIKFSPLYINTVFLLTTGAETTECAIKLARIYGRKISDKKIGIVSFKDSMHGKTLGALMVGGKEKEKHWIVNHDPDIHHLPFPFPLSCPWAENDSHKCNKCCFEKSMEELGKKIDLSTIAAFMIESYQGWGALFYPKIYLQTLEKWARKNNALIIFDEIQSGFGRTGKFFAFQHYGVKPDIICCGKGISSSLPLSAVLGRREILDVDPSLNSTHGGNPVCCAATLASLEIIEGENLVNKTAHKGMILQNELKKLQKKYNKIICAVCGKGLIFALHITNPKTGKLDSELCDKILEKCMEKGLLMVRTGAGTLKIGPPLIIPEDALLEGIKVIDEAIHEIRTVI